MVGLFGALSNNIVLKYILKYLILIKSAGESKYVDGSWERSDFRYFIDAYFMW